MGIAPPAVLGKRSRNPQSLRATDNAGLGLQHHTGRNRLQHLALEVHRAVAVSGPMDVFYRAGVMWDYSRGEALTPFSDVQVATTRGASFKCLNGMRLVPDGAMHDMQEADLILVSFLLDIERTLQARDEVVDRLKDRSQRGGHMDSEMGRSSQAPFAVFHHRKDHHDSQMLAAQEWIEIHYEPQEIPENRPGGFEKGPNPP